MAKPASTLPDDMHLQEAALPEEMAMVRELFCEYQEFLGVDLCFQNFEAELAGLPGLYAPPEGRLYLSFWQGELAGCIALKPLDVEANGSKVAEIKRLYLRKPYQGKGIGRAMLFHTLKAAKSIGYSKIRMDSLRRLKAATSLYDKLPVKEILPYNENPLDDAYYIELALDEVRV